MKIKTTYIAIIFFSIILFCLATIYYIKSTKEDYLNISKEILRQEAKSLISNMINTREWNALHEGVYVKAKKGDKPNKYLKDNHIYSKNNELLIRINPAWMTKQISSISNKQEGYFFNITSLNPINPKNEADKFEKTALNYFEKNKKALYYDKLNSNSYDYMQALIVEKECLYCHKQQGYKLGDIRGGLRVTIPSTIHNKNTQLIQSKTNILYLSVAFLGIFFFLFFIYLVNNLSKNAKKSKKLNSILQKRINQRTKELREKNAELKKIATRDYLTNIPNRRYFFEIGEKSFLLAKREKKPLSVICIDIDFFKKINDTYGHQIGDEVLKFTTKIMKSCIRKSDILARIGGEEFSIILHNTSLKGAGLVAEKIRKKIERKVFDNKEVKVKLTVSLGVCSLNAKDKKLECLIAKADKALYKAKENGRNQSISY